MYAFLATYLFSSFFSPFFSLHFFFFVILLPHNPPPHSTLSYSSLFPTASPAVLWSQREFLSRMIIHITVAAPFLGGRGGSNSSGNIWLAANLKLYENLGLERNVFRRYEEEAGCGA